MRNLKRVLSLGLASVMLMGMMVTGAGAANKDFSDAADIDNVEAVDVMVALGILEGTDKGEFLPDSILTREQAAKIICSMLLGPENADKLSTTGVTFSDVAADRWSAPYIAYCVNMGILAGDGTGKFLPEAQLDGASFAKMLLVALGYDAGIEKYVGSDWMVNVATDALAAGIVPQGMVMTEKVSRQDAAQMALMTLEATLVEYENKGSSIDLGNGVIINQGASKAKAVTYISANGYDYTTGANDAAAGDSVEFCEKYFKDLKKGTGNDDFGRSGTEWKLDGETDAIGVYGDEAKYTVVLDENYSFGNGQQLYDGLRDVLRDETGNKKLTVNDDTTVWLNGKNISTGVSAEKDALKAGLVIEVFHKDNVITNLVGYNYTLAQITDVDTDVTDDQADDGVSAVLTIDGEEYENTNIAGYNAKTYVKDAYVAVVVDADTNDKNNDNIILASYIPETVEGSISTKNTTNLTVTVDGTKYTAAGTYVAGAMNTAISNSLAIGSENTYTLYLDNNGYVIGIELVEGADPTIDDVYYLSMIWQDTSADDYGKPANTFHAQLVALDGTVKTVELEAKDIALKDQTNVEDSDEKSYLSNKANYEGKLVTISDKKWSYADDETQPVTHEFKASNDKFDLTVFDGDDDWATKDASAATEFTKDMTRMTVGNTYRFNSNTQYVLVSETGADLKASVVTGGISYTVSSDKVYFITEKNSSTVKFVVIGSADEIKQNVEFNEDLVFVADTDATEVGDGYVMQTVYFVDGTSETVKVAEDKTAGSVGFYAYAVNEDGYYELDGDVEAMTITANSGGKYIWDGEAGVVENATMAGDALYDGLLTVTVSSNEYEDIKVSGAKFVDAHDKDADGQYTKSVSSLQALADLLDAENSKVKDVELALNVSEDGAVIVILTSIKPNT